MSVCQPAFMARDRERSSQGVCWWSTANSSSDLIAHTKGVKTMHKAIAMLLLAVPVTLLAQTPKLTIDDLLNPGLAGGFGRGRGDAETPDGKYIVTVEKGQIALRPKAGGESKILTSTPEPKSELELSPDGQRVSYVSQGQVWVAALDSSEPPL